MNDQLIKLLQAISEKLSPFLPTISTVRSYCLNHLPVLLLGKINCAQLLDPRVSSANDVVCRTHKTTVSGYKKAPDNVRGYVQSG